MGEGVNQMTTHFVKASISRDVKDTQGASIKYVGRRGGGGLAKCLCYYISLCSKLAYGGGGVQNW